MPFHFKRKESATKAIRRICRERLDDALKSLQHGDRLEGVHQVRKEIKKLRAVLRLARGKIGKNNYKENIKSLRNAANHLTTLRDAQVKLIAFEKLTKHFSRKLTARPFPKIKKVLRENCCAEERKFLKGSSIRAVNRILKPLKKSVGELKLDADGWAAICPGLNASYCRGQDALKTVCKERSPENFHEWRKRVKDLWYDLRLLCPVWPQELRAAADELEKLGEFLGDDHDLVMLKEFIADNSKKAKEEKVLNELICAGQKELRVSALQLGSRFYSEKPNRFCKRFENYWKLWRDRK